MPTSVTGGEHEDVLTGAGGAVLAVALTGALVVVVVVVVVGRGCLLSLWDAMGAVQQ